jgi:hypothetical protein
VTLAQPKTEKWKRATCSSRGQAFPTPLKKTPQICISTKSCSPLSVYHTMVAAPQLGFCGIESLRCTFPAHYPLPNRIRVRRRANRIFSVATEPKPNPTGSSKSTSPNTVNGSSRSPPSPNSANGSAKSPSLKSVNGVSTVNELAEFFFSFYF